MLKGSDIASRSEAGLLYADLVLSDSYDSSLWAINYIIQDCESTEYNRGVARAKTSKAWLLLIKVDYEEALKNAHEALVIQEEEGTDSLEMAKTLNMIGMINLEFNQLEESKRYMEQALKLIQLIGDTIRIDRAYNNLGVLSGRLERFNEAIDYYKRSRKLRVLLKDNGRVAYSDFNLASTYLKLNELDSAGFYFDRSIERFINHTKHREVPDMVHIGLGEYYMATGDFDKAIYHINTGLKLSIDLGYSDRWIWGYDLLSEALHKSGQHNAAYEALKQRIVLADSINEATNASAIAEIEEQYQSAKTEKKMMRLRAENLEQENKIISMRFYNTSIVIAALAFIFILLMLNWSRVQKKKVSEASLQAALASTKLVALRSQMNSHFIFNCINTAQNFVLNAEKEKSYDYLSKFAKLLRSVLENSNLNFIPLEDEIDLVKNYMDIESIRFSHKFSYDLALDKELESEVFEIPSMIIQPFVENAIVHGLINLEDRFGKLKIKLSKIDQQILCEIEDNGVGRKKAAEIKERKQRHYKSQAFSNIKERLNLFHQKGEAMVHFEIFDLHDTKGNASGTSVKIWLPFN